MPSALFWAGGAGGAPRSGGGTRWVVGVVRASLGGGVRASFAFVGGVRWACVAGGGVCVSLGAGRVFVGAVLRATVAGAPPRVTGG